MAVQNRRRRERRARAIAHSLWVGILALLGSVVLAISWTITTAVALQATTALIMGGTGHPLVAPTDQPPFVTAYLNNAIDSYIDPAAAAGTGTAGPATNAVAVYTPEQFFPVAGSGTFGNSVATGLANLHNCIAVSACVYNNDPAVTPTVGSQPPAPTDQFIVFGYSQSAVIAALAKRDLINSYQPGDPSISFFLVADPMRPNGGILMRFKGFPTIPLLNIPFYGAAPTNSAVVNDGGTPNDPSDDTYAYPTVDVAQQYDGLGGDFPVRPLNLLATANAIAGYIYLHGNVVNQPLSDALFQGKVGDTSYYLFPTSTLPILMPLQQIGVPKPILGFLDAPLRVIIEDAYARTVSPGTPTGISILPIGNPVALAVHLVESIPVGIDNALQDLGVGRVLGTTAPGTFGVGGPSLPVAAATTATPQAHSAKTETLATQPAAGDVSNTKSATTGTPPEPRPKVHIASGSGPHKRQTTSDETSKQQSDSTSSSKTQAGEHKKAA